ncbi:MAG: TlpA disulfide reductase family protein [Bacteroidota bacterium]|nr:TlpA disulfide reductase family protein [Bacteroidota bacterium]
MEHRFSKQTFSVIFFILIISLSFAACQEKNTEEINDQIVVTGFIQNLTDTVLTFTYEEYKLLAGSQTTEILIDSTGHFKFNLSSFHPIKGFVSFGKTPIVYKFDINLVNGKDSSLQVGSFDFKIVYLYLQPGDSLHMAADVNQIENTLTFTGTGADNNMFVNEEDWEFNAYKQKYLRNYYSLAEMQVNDKTKFVKELHIKQGNKLRKSSQNLGLSNHLIELYETSYQYQAIRSMIYYPAGYAGFNNGQLPDLPTDYYAFMDSVELPDNIDNLGIGAYYFLNSYLRKKYTLAGSEQSGYPDFYSFTESQLPERLGYVFKAYALSRDFCKELYDVFGDQCPYQDIASLVKEKYQHLEGMLEGNPLPDFNIVNFKGGEVSLGDLQGNFIYIDFWATWCGPCIKEIPSLKLLEDEFEDDPIHFVSISFDQERDTLKWKDFVRDNQLTGIQLLADETTNKKLSAALNIKSIPRFVLLDREGKIIDANAPRPSNPKLKEILMELVSTSE